MSDINREYKELTFSFCYSYSSFNCDNSSGITCTNTIYYRFSNYLQTLLPLHISLSILSIFFALIYFNKL